MFGLLRGVRVSNNSCILKPLFFALREERRLFYAGEEMKYLIAAAYTALCLSMFSGCGKPAPRTAEQILNTPQTKSEAAELMQSLDRDAAEQNLTPQVLQHIRRQMKGRLLSAGMSEEEIETWIESNPHTSGSTNITTNRKE